MAKYSVLLVQLLLAISDINATQKQISLENKS